jgi:hypothetical protein
LLERNGHVCCQVAWLVTEALLSQSANVLEEVETTDRSGATITAGENIDGNFKTGPTF